MTQQVNKKIKLHYTRLRIFLSEPTIIYAIIVFAIIYIAVFVRSKVYHNINNDKIKLNNNNNLNHCIVQNGCNLYLEDIPYFMNKSIIISGMIKNGELTIKPILNQLDEISCIFKNTLFLIYESNSEDNTKFILNQWIHSYDNDHDQERFCNFTRQT